MTAFKTPSELAVQTVISNTLSTLITLIISGILTLRAIVDATSALEIRKPGRGKKRTKRIDTSKRRPRLLIGISLTLTVAT